MRVRVSRQLCQALGTGYNGSVLLARGKNRAGKFAIKAFKLHGVSKESLGWLSD